MKYNYKDVVMQKLKVAGRRNLPFRNTQSDVILSLSSAQKSIKMRFRFLQLLMSPTLNILMGVMSLHTIKKS